MMIFTSFKEGSVRVLVRLQAPTFLGREGTKIDITFRLKMTDFQYRLIRKSVECPFK